LKKDYQILIIFGTNILDTMATEWPFKFEPHPKSASALPAKKRNKRSMRWNEQKKTINFISPHPWPQLPLPQSIFLMFAVSYSSESIGRRLGMSNSKSDQNMIDTAVNEWRKHLHVCVSTKSWYFEYLL